jgi:hypothetical protein
VSVRTSFPLGATPAEIDLLEQAMTCFDAACAGRMATSDLVDAAFPDPKGEGRRMVGLRSLFDTELGTACGVTVERTAEGARVEGRGTLNLHAVAELVRLCCPSALPTSIAWVSDATIAGGWIAIHADRCTHGDVAGEARHQIARLAERTPPSDLQYKAAESYAQSDDGNMLSVMGRTDLPIREILRNEGGDTLAAFIYDECSGLDDDEEGREEAADLLRKAAGQLEETACSLEARR